MYTMNQPVNTPKGIGHVTGKTLDGKLAVELWKSDHKEDWEIICPTNGPSKLFFSKEDELTIMEKKPEEKPKVKRPEIQPGEVPLFNFVEIKKKRGRPRRNAI